MFKKYILQVIIFILLIAIAWVLLLLRQPLPQKDNLATLNPVQPKPVQSGGDAIEQNLRPEYYPIRNWLVDEPEISAKSAIMVAFNNDEKEMVLYQKNSYQQLPIASLTKIMTAVIALENLNPEDVIRVSKNSVMIDGDKGGLIIDENLSVKDLLYIMLIESSNDAANALANDNQKISFEEFVSLMNKKAKDLGLNNVHFEDPTGLSEKNQSTVRDLTKIIKYSLNFPLLAEIIKTPQATISSSDKKFVHNLINTNKLLGKIPVVLGGKTGFTQEAGGCMFALSNINNHYLVTVILGSQSREEDTEKLINWAQNGWLWK